MEFNSLFFLFLWLPVFVFLAYLTGRSRFYPFVLFAFSFCFYALSDIRHLPLLLGMVVCTYVFALLLEKKKNVYFIYLFLTILYLCLFKYGNSVLERLPDLFSGSVVSLIMPVGISFYVFTSISYISDCYYGKIPAEKNFLLLACYLTFFPTIISGPLHRFADFEEYMHNPEISADTIARGLRRFLLGLGKKVLIANQMAFIVNKAFDADAELSLPLAWYGLIALVLQMYYDFSAYSDMAIGIAGMAGYTVPENFDHPYLATSFGDFWKRWHISLTGWFRDYVYIPLGGNRVSLLRWLVNMLTVWLLTGIWHGSTLNFLFWGLYNFVILVFERKVFRIKNPYLGWFITMILVAGGWLIFKTDSLPQLADYLRALAGRGYAVDMLYIRSLDILYLLPLTLVAGILLFVPLLKPAFSSGKAFSVSYDCFLIVLLVLSVIFILSGSYSAFIYFGF